MRNNVKIYEAQSHSVRFLQLKRASGRSQGFGSGSVFTVLLDPDLNFEYGLMQVRYSKRLNLKKIKYKKPQRILITFFLMKRQKIFYSSSLL